MTVEIRIWSIVTLLNENPAEPGNRPSMLM